MEIRKIALPEEIGNTALRGYARLYQLERWFRELVYVELKAHFGSDWWLQAEGALKRSKSGGIPAEKSLKADKKHPHMSTPENDPLWFVSFDSLLKIVFDKKLWRVFSGYLTTKGLLRAKFEEVRPIRHRIAHCRAVHPEDVARIEHLMKDIDKGFWSFCTSYNAIGSAKFSFPGDPVYSTFAATRPPSNLDYDVEFSVRPNRWSKIKSLLGQRGVLYDFDFYFHASTGKLMDNREILASTRKLHDRVVHIMLNSFQQSLRLTIPAVLPQERIIETAEAFWDACSNCVTVVPYYREKKLKRLSTSGIWKEHKERNAPFEFIASEWPHYVLPPSNPLTFLDSGMECSFFGA